MSLRYDQGGEIEMEKVGGYSPQEVKQETLIFAHLATYNFLNTAID